MRRYLINGFITFKKGPGAMACGRMTLDDNEVMDEAGVIAAEAYLLANVQAANPELEITGWHIGSFQPLEVPSTPRIGSVPAIVSLNLPENLPPVGCPILILLSGVLVPCERVDHLRSREDDMTYVLDDKQVISGRFKWTYP